MKSVAANIYINSMKLENTAAVILSYVLLVCIFLGGHYSLPCWLAHGLSSVEVFCCSNLWTEILLEVPLICFSPLEWLLEIWKVMIVRIFLQLNALALSRQPDFSSSPLAGWWCGSLAKKKIWQRNPCPYGGGQPLGCRYAYVWVHRHPVLHTVFSSVGFLAKSQRDRYLLAVSCVDFAVGISRRNLVCCFSSLAWDVMSYFDDRLK